MSSGNTELRQWQSRLQVAHRKHEEMEKKIKRWRKYYRGQQWNTENSAGYNDKTVENMVFSNIRTIMPSINLNNPKIYCKPVKKPYVGKQGYFDTIGASIIWEILMNYYYRELQIKRQVDKAINDALIGPWGLVQLGYTLETQKVKDDDLIEIHELIKSESVFCVRRSPFDLRFDVEATDSYLADARWIALRWVKSLEDVKANPKFTNMRNLKVNTRTKTDNFDAEVPPGGYKADESSFSDFGDSEVWGRVEGWDIWDKKTHQIKTYVKGHDKFLRDDKWPLDLDGFPIEIIYFNENPDESYPISDVDIYLSAQDELNRIHSLQLDHIRRISQRRYLAQENMVDSEEMRKIERGGDGTIAIVRGKPTEVIVPMQDATISQDVYIIGQGLKSSIREMAGLSAMEKGVSQKYDTAQEPARIAEGASAIRQERLTTLEGFIKRITKKMSKIIQQTMDTHNIPLDTEQFELAHEHTPDKLASIVGDAGEKVILPWLKADKKDLKGDYDFDIEVGSTQPVNDDVRKRDAVMLYKMTTSNPYIRKREGTKYLLDAFNVIEADKFIKSDKEVQEEAMKNLGMKIKSEQAIDEPKRQVDMAKTKIKADVALKTHGMKAEGEQVKAQNLREKHAMEMRKLGADTQAKIQQSNIKTQEMAGKARMNLLQAALRGRKSNEGNGGNADAQV